MSDYDPEVPGTQGADDVLLASLVLTCLALGDGQH